MPYTGSGSNSGGGGGRGGGRGSGGGGRGSGGGGRGSSSRSYPRGVGPDFRKLTGLTLLQYIDHHGVPIRDDAPPSELAVAVARHFETLEVPEDDAVDGFLERLAAGTEAVDYARRTAAWTKSRSTSRRRRQYAARPGEQVAAKVTRTDENGSWILASVQKFYPDTETYDVQDEDDVSKLIRLPWTHVMQLGHSPAGAPGGTTGAGAGAALPEQRWYTKNKECMAIFPETTSFYRAIVSKAPVWTWDEQRRCPVVQELVVKFEDDEDAAGRTPHRRVPSRYVIPLPAEYFHEESEDVDLSTTTTTGAPHHHHHHRHNGATVNVGK